jgi:hypothetical protein
MIRCLVLIWASVKKTALFVTMNKPLGEAAAHIQAISTRSAVDWGAMHGGPGTWPTVRAARLSRNGRRGDEIRRGRNRPAGAKPSSR